MKTMNASSHSKPDKYQRILDAAVKVFAQQGFHQATIAQIARAAGVADGTIYLYFKNKEDILVQFYGYKARQVFESLKEEVRKASDATDKLRNLIRCHLEQFQRDRDMAVVYQAGTRKNTSPLVDDQIRAMSKTYLDMAAGIIELGQQQGTIRKNLYLGLVKRFIMGAVDDVINTWVLSGGKYDLASMADPLVDLLFRGIGSSEPQRGA